MPLSDVAEEIFRSESEGGVKVALTLKAKTVVEDAFAQGVDVAVDMVEDCSALDSPGPSAPAPAPAPHLPHDSRQGGPALVHPRGAKTRPSEPEPEPEDGWHDMADEDEEPHQFPFCPWRTPEVQLDLQQDYSPLDLFRLFFSTDVLNLLCDYTNGNTARKHAQDCIRHGLMWMLRTC
ncbi:hypothetical protein SKAU_G00273960 [Synaphobranchus kaupii]|uniref:Uncharacterized protein n=1 Tax=Synaphobranchus kaupii TaxID=118154 RepID=A0A9Q1F0U1_SYNKA|nr:hypothetical protein SKAU_G00273960 [Synaphobranchus kaupii]